MNRIFYALFSLLLSGNLWAQDYPNGFYFLRNDTIFDLNQKQTGALQLLPYYQADFLDTIGSLAYHPDEQYWYGVSFVHGTVIRFRTDGYFENLGRPIHEKNGTPMPNEELSSAIIVGHELYVLSYASNSIFAIELSERPLRYRDLVSLPQRLPNGLGFDPYRRELLVFHQYGGSIYINPETGAAEIENNKYKNFQRNSFLIYGKFWMDKAGYPLMLHGRQGDLVSIDLKEKVVYDITNTGFASPKDAVQAMPSRLQFPQELTHLEVKPYIDQALQIEWIQGQRRDIDRYELQAYRKDHWVKLQSFPAYNAYQSSGRYAGLDRYAEAGEQCYRLRIDYQGGHSRYSPSVCIDWQQEIKTPRLRPSPQLISSEWPYMQLQALNWAGRKIRLRLYRAWDNALVLEQELEPILADQAFWLEIPQGQGWHWVELVSDGHISRQKLYLDLKK